MMALRQYSTHQRVLCSPSKQRVYVAQLPTGKKTRFRKQWSHWSIFVISDECMHVCVGASGEGWWMWQWNKISALIGAHLLMKLFQNHRLRGHTKDEPWRWHQSPERNNKRRLVLVKTKGVCLRPLFSLSGFVLWVENVTTQYTDLSFFGNRLSLCWSAEDWREGWAESSPLVFSTDHMSG